MISDSDLIILVFAFLFGFISERTGPQTYEYKDELVVIGSGYQCPTYCAIRHNHHVQLNKSGLNLNEKNNKMYVNECDLGAKIKKNRNKK